jgi:anaerobic selenocysteine-containing dehydrogenase
MNCWDGCAWLVEVAGGEVQAVRGAPDHEITRGFLCPKAQYYLERHRSPRRLRTPIRRSGRGWREVSWDAALDELAERIGKARRETGSQSILSYTDAGSLGLLKGLDRRFWNLLGPITVPTGSLCWSAGLAAQEADFGDNLAHDPTDHANSRFLLIWGRNPLDTNVHLWPFVQQAREGGARVVVIDPVATRTAGQADLHLAPRPGSDLALALAMGQSIIEAGMMDEEFLGSRVRGFDDYRRLCAGYAPERAEAITGLRAATIRELAHEYARRSPAAILLGYGLQRHPAGGATVRAIDALAALTGNIGLPGGGVAYANRFAASSFADLIGRPAPHRGVPRAKLGQMLPQLDEPRIGVGIVARANPAAQLPRTSLAMEALSSIEFLAVIDFEMTDTAELADLVLPASTSFEQEDVYTCAWHNYITYGEQAVEPVPDCRSDLQIYGGLADRLGLGEVFGSRRTPREWIDEALRPLAAWGLSADGLRGRSVRHPAAPLVPWQDGRFLTGSGKLELIGPGYSPLPDGTADPRYPFRLITPQHRLSIHSQFYARVQAAFGQPAEAEPVVMVNDRLARELCLRSGAGISVVSPWGRLACRVKPMRGLNRDTLVIYSGGRVGSNCANALTPDRLTDIGLGAAYYDCPCRLEAEDVSAAQSPH